MNDAMVQGSASAVAERVHVGHAQMPLSFLKAGERARIAKVRGKGEMHHHLETLGFVEGAEVMVVCESAGNLIVEVKGAQVAINKQVATKIITK
ncbi:MAG: FeoA family protein [Raoultibacter sp.]|jgi:ferrous iron transport protein A